VSPWDWQNRSASSPHLCAGLISGVRNLEWRRILILDDEQQIHALFDAGDRALMSADVESLARIFADDYVQYDSAGRAFTKQQVLENLRSGTVRYPVINSTGRRIRLFGDFAIVHGSESDEVDSEGSRFAVRYLYMDVVCRRNGHWQIVGSQLLKPDQ
jgi:ketosteroid isomerase-like protein